jgi:acyl-CoA synthetase (AMP-forming)/AMP-acid ligase II
LYENNKLSLRYVIFGGEGLNIQTLKPWLNHHGDDSPQLINMYGITETTVHVTLRRIHRSDLANKKDDREGNTSISSNQADSGSIIGKPLAGAEIYLLDDDLQLVDDGEIGEIMVGGWGVTRGYLNREELTAERFITKPGNGCRLYRSGDLGKRLPNGELVYLGRIDQQVKLRGYRIELGEIEAVMLHHPSISRTCVICQEVGDGEPMLVAYYVANHDTEEKLKQQRLREFIATRLPGYMVPGAFVELESLPLTVNGNWIGMPSPQRVWPEPVRPPTDPYQ